MYKLFTSNSPYKKRARFAAILWTLLIFILCLMPGKDIPNIKVPFIDKWTHFALFGVFAFLWYSTKPTQKISFVFFIFIIAAALGWLIETLQGLFPSLGRSKDVMDMVADCTGGLIGIAIFYFFHRRAERKLQA
jgi:VanZ family protein